MQLDKIVEREQMSALLMRALRDSFAIHDTHLGPIDVLSVRGLINSVVGKIRDTVRYTPYTCKTKREALIFT